MKVLEIIKRIILGILAVVFFAFAVCMTILLLNYNKYGVTQFGDRAIILVKETISSEKYKKGDLVIVKHQKIDQLNIGDIAFAYHVDNQSGAVTIDLGEIDKISETDGEKGAIAFKNGGTYAMEFVAGTAEKVYPKVGTYLSIVESTWGFLFIILIPGFLIFIYELYALIVEIKYGKDEE